MSSLYNLFKRLGWEKERLTLKFHESAQLSLIGVV